MKRQNKNPPASVQGSKENNTRCCISYQCRAYLKYHHGRGACNYDNENCLDYVDRRRMVELREETGVQRSLTERLVRSRLQWAGHVERMADDRLPKRAAELCEQGRRRRGRPSLRWEDCVKRDVRKAGEEEDWKKKTRDRGGWKILSDEAVKKLRAAPHP